VNAAGKTLVVPPAVARFRQNLIGNDTGVAKKLFSRKLGIQGGTDAALGEFPHVVALQVYSSKYNEVWRCSGTLFAYNLVITSGKSLLKFFYWVFAKNDKKWNLLELIINN
jgi:hypothetical protein